MPSTVSGCATNGSGMSLSLSSWQFAIVEGDDSSRNREFAFQQLPAATKSWLASNFIGAAYAAQARRAACYRGSVFSAAAISGTAASTGRM